MASLYNDLSTVSRCTAVDDEFDAIDHTFWSVVNSLPPDSPFMRRLTAMFQDPKTTASGEHDSDRGSGQDESSKSGQGDGHRLDRILRSRTASPATSKAKSAPKADATRSQDDAAFYDKQATDPRVERRPNGAYIRYGATGDDKYPISSAPPLAAAYGPGEAPLCALPIEVRAALIQAFDNLYPDKELEVIGVSISSTLKRPPRSRIQMTTDEVNEHMRNKTPMPPVFVNSLNLLTWAQVQTAWSNVTYNIDDYMGASTAPDGTPIYNGARPIVFNEEDARRSKYLVVNIYYNNCTYCIACRHKTYLHDQHPWCMSCTVLAGYWPCTGGKHDAVCLHCSGYKPVTKTRCQEEWKRIYDPATGFNTAKLLDFRPRLPVPLVFQFDATLSTILRNLWREDASVAQNALNHSFITAYHIKRPTVKQQSSQQLEEGEVPPETDRRRSGRQRKSAVPSTSAAIDTAIDTDAEDTEAVMFQTAIQRSMADTPGSPAVRGRGRKSDPGPSSQGARQESGSPAKKSRKSSGGKVHIPTLRDYTSLQFPWCLIARAFLSQMKFKPVSYLDGVQGCVPDDSSTIDMKGQLTRIWNGEQAVRCRFSENGQTWGLVYVPKGSPQALPPPALPVPTPALLATAVVKPASFTFVTNVPIRFREIYDLRAADWPGFIEERIMTNYRPMFPHLHATDRWRPLLPDDYHDPTVTLPYDSAHLVPVISAPTFARSWNALEQMDLDSLRANMKQYFRADGGVPVRTHSHIWWRQCGKATFLRQDTASQQHHLDRPLLLPLHDPEDPVVPPRDRRPLLLSAVRKVHRQPPVFGGITPTAIRFLNARAEEQSSYIMNSDAAAPHVMTYRSKRMRLYTGPYLENQDAQFPLRTLRVPELAAWGQRLATPLDFNVAYPVTDLSLRYTEALARLQIYQLSHREQSLAHLDFDPPVYAKRIHSFPDTSGTKGQGGFGKAGVCQTREH